MTAKRNWSNFAVSLLALFMVIAVWQVFYSPNIPVEIPRYTKSAYTLYTNTSNYVYPIDSLTEIDYNQLIDLNFTFQMNNLVCNETSPLVLVMVHTSPKNFAKRRTIRETWGRYRDKVKLLFVVGDVENSTLKRKLIEENQNYSDFTQGSFKDTYRNLTYKHVMLFKYVIYHCPEARYIMKTDDDVFVNMPTMMNFLTQELSPFGAGNLLFCNSRANSRVLRSYRSKWRVSFSEYPAKNYPTYCPGWFLLYSQNVVFNLYKEAQKSKYFWIDDIHLTGTLVKKLNLVHEDSKPYMISQDELNDVVDGGNITRPFLIGQPNLSEKQIRSLWNYVDSHSVSKNIIQ
ncbi:beta-1,3-galactosyltransferase 5-like [Coccinella septempunctata]|uniref:beta-1,3-galactosyltransferase 5-like n=1 Tax=Coccinella septempunctata TaxID=41139 RepID=UPI001D08C9DD|nr:beta-1,3-galactosyltransferase 5-like [Coccinella septempunctata]XP_044766996.1 beta-1,3-galactosyltransferase 5-like [Coccinella septempunctata]XP_044766997.1 beta-1,3-galactosyltransferase 5-like [Coccinella septempunctata]XP_044766998.1 beta-1,3-galactosyltransferase 5-like [Coccinella septempunctata]